MRATRCLRNTQLMRSFPRSAWEYCPGCSAFQSVTRSVTRGIPTRSVGTIECGSWLACDAGNSVSQEYPVDEIVPTLCVGILPGMLCVPKRDAERHKRHSHAERGNDRMWELACLRC